MIDEEAEEFGIELNRVVERLRTMPLTKLKDAAELTRPVLAEMAIMAGQQRPVPVIAERALGDQCAVLGQDLRGSGQPCGPAGALLRELRLALP